MSATDSVLAICVNWNGREVLARTVNSLLQSDYGGLQVLVVDNASTDDSLSSLPENVETLELTSNRGYGGAINAAVRPRLENKSANYFLLLNNDVVLHKETLRLLMEFAASKKTGVFGPRIVQFNNPAKLEAAWGKVSWSHVLAKYYGKNDLKTDARWEETRSVELLLGSVLLVHHEIFEEVGLFDERFFLYHEEVDFLYRTCRSGFPVFYCPFAEAIHHGAYSTRRQPLKKIFWVRKNAVYFLRKHNADSRKWIFFWSTLAMSLLHNTMRLRWSRVSTIWKAVKEGLEI